MSARWLVFHVTDRCQLDCQHCLRDPGQKPRDLPLALMERVLDEAKKIYRIGHVSLTGGEPTLHPQFDAVIDAIVARGCSWHLVTNGRRMASLLAMAHEKPERRALLGTMNISLDGADESTHDRIRGAGSFREVMQAAAACVAHGCDFQFNVTINAVNVHQVEAIGMLAAQLGAKRILVGMLHPSGTMHDETLRLRAREWHDVKSRLERLSGTLRLDIESAEGFPNGDRFHVCQAFRSEPLHVDIEGNLNLCCIHSGVPGARSDIGGNLHAMPLHQAHAGLLGVIDRAQRDRVAYLAENEGDAWDDFSCNSCLKYFGKPHWSDEGAVGPEAQRERWTGAWSPEQQRQRLGDSTGPKRLPILR